MFDKLQQAARLNDDGSFPYLRSHPLTTERMADMKARIPGLRSPLEAGTPAVSPTYHALMSARARVLAETSTERLRNIASVLSLPTDTPTDPAALASVYGATLAAARTRDAQGLRWGLRRLEAAQTGDAPSRQAIQWLQLETLLMLPDAANNASLRQRRDDLAQLGLNSSDREGVLLGAQAAVAGNAEQQRLATQRLLRPGWCCTRKMPWPGKPCRPCTRPCSNRCERPGPTPKRAWPDSTPPRRWTASKPPSNGRATRDRWTTSSCPSSMRGCATRKPCCGSSCATLPPTATEGWAQRSPPGHAAGPLGL
jgi:hypothetical protein